MAVNKGNFYQKYGETISSAYPYIGAGMKRVPCYDYDDFMTLVSGMEFDSEMRQLD